MSRNTLNDSNFMRDGVISYIKENFSDCKIEDIENPKLELDDGIILPTVKGIKATGNFDSVEIYFFNGCYFIVSNEETRAGEILDFFEKDFNLLWDYYLNDKKKEVA